MGVISKKRFIMPWCVGARNRRCID